MTVAERVAPAATVSFRSRRLEAAFAACFARDYNTRLLGGADEPVYIPAGEDWAAGATAYHRLYYREDYFASALHEVAHWCIAGRERRLRRDFGYWYAPDGRDAARQAAFQRVEVAPQALESCFARVCGFPFRVSLDNLDGGEVALASERAFAAAVRERAASYMRDGLPPRARRFAAALAAEFGSGFGSGIDPDGPG